MVYQDQPYQQISNMHITRIEDDSVDQNDDDELLVNDDMYPASRRRGDRAGHSDAAPPRRDGGISS